MQVTTIMSKMSMKFGMYYGYHNEIIIHEIVFLFYKSYKLLLHDSKMKLLMEGTRLTEGEYNYHYYVMCQRKGPG